MRIEKTIVFEDGDENGLRRIMERCNEARSFFDEEGLRSVQVVASGGHPLHHSHMSRAVEAVAAAVGKVRARCAHALFPAELKKRYDDNLTECFDRLSEWERMLLDERAMAWYFEGDAEPEFEKDDDSR